MSINYAFAVYTIVYILILLFIIPSVIMVIFGYLNYQNIRQTRVLAEQQADRQLTQMIFTQIIIVVISITPFGIYSFYTLITMRVIRNVD